MPSLRYRNKKILFSHQPPHAGPLDRSAYHAIFDPGRNPGDEAKIRTYNTETKLS